MSDYRRILEIMAKLFLYINIVSWLLAWYHMYQQNQWYRHIPNSVSIYPRTSQYTNRVLSGSQSLMIFYMYLSVSIYINQCQKYVRHNTSVSRYSSACQCARKFSFIGLCHQSQVTEILAGCITSIFPVGVQDDIMITHDDIHDSYDERTKNYKNDTKMIPEADSHQSRHAIFA